MRFCFFSWYEDLKGGYTTLLINLIKGLHHKGEDVVLLNFKGGLIENELVKSGVQIKIIDCKGLNANNIKDFFYSTDVFIISKFHEYFKILLSVNPKVIYYDINDFIAQISDYKWKIRLPWLSRKLISELLIKKSLLFMDDTGIVNIRTTFGIKVDHPDFLPIPIDITIPSGANQFQKRPADSSEILNITYIGRSVRWKLMILKKIIIDCRHLNQLIKFHILVDNKKALFEILSLDKLGGENTKIEVYENLPPSQIEEFLLTHSDLHFGMGTTALHSAILGIPTIIIDSSENEFPDNYSYTWLFETENYCLGRFIEKRGFRKGINMNDIIELLRDKDKVKMISEKTFQYVLSNHYSEKIIEKLISYSQKSSFRLKDAKWLIPFYYRSHRVVKSISKFLSLPPK